MGESGVASFRATQLVSGVPFPPGLGGLALAIALSASWISSAAWMAMSLCFGKGCFCICECPHPPKRGQCHHAAASESAIQPFDGGQTAATLPRCHRYAAQTGLYYRSAIRGKASEREYPH